VKRFFEVKIKRAVIATRLELSCICLSLVLAFAAMAGSNTLSANAKDTCELVAWYVRGGYWREDVKAYLTQAEYVLYPKSGAGARMDLEEDE
jgi:hypothetical protein